MRLDSRDLQILFCKNEAKNLPSYFCSWPVGKKIHTKNGTGLDCWGRGVTIFKLYGHVSGQHCFPSNAMQRVFQILQNHSWEGAEGSNQIHFVPWMGDGFVSICFRLYAYQFLGLPVLTKRLLSVSHQPVAFIYRSPISKSYEEIGWASLALAIPLSLGDFMTFRFIGMDENIGFTQTKGNLNINIINSSRKAQNIVFSRIKPLLP